MSAGDVPFQPSMAQLPKSVLVANFLTELGLVRDGETLGEAESRVSDAFVSSLPGNERAAAEFIAVLALKRLSAIVDMYSSMFERGTVSREHLTAVTVVWTHIMGALLGDQQNLALAEVQVVRELKKGMS